MEQEAKQHPYIGHIARSMQRMAHEYAKQKYAKQIITRQLDVKSITVGSTNGFELTLTDKRQQQTAKVQPGVRQLRLFPDDGQMVKSVTR